MEQRIRIIQLLFWVLKTIQFLLSTQTVYSNPIRRKWVKPNKKRLLIEQSIFKQSKYIAVNASFMPELIEKYCPNPIFFKGGFPISKPTIENSLSIKKKFDFVFYARLAPNKGGVDALKALAIMKKDNPNVSLLFIGIKKGDSYSDSIEKLAKTLKHSKKHDSLCLVSKSRRIYGKWR